MWAIHPPGPARPVLHQVACRASVFVTNVKRSGKAAVRVSQCLPLVSKRARCSLSFTTPVRPRVRSAMLGRVWRWSGRFEERRRTNQQNDLPNFLSSENEQSTPRVHGSDRSESLSVLGVTAYARATPDESTVGNDPKTREQGRGARRMLLGVLRLHVPPSFPV